MKVSTHSLIAFSILAAGRNAAVSAAGGIEVTNLDIDKVLAYHRIVVDSADPSESKPYRAAVNNGARGDSLIHSKLVQKLQAVANGSPFLLNDPALPKDADNEWIEVQNTFLSGTSDYHQDYKVVGDRRAPCGSKAVLADEMVAFVVLDTTNKEAYFEHTETSVPIRKGDFIRFKGSDPHRTIVNKGHIKLLGPFEMKSFVKVTVRADSCCNVDGTCSDSEFGDDDDICEGVFVGNNQCVQGGNCISGFACFLRQCLNKGPASFHYDFALNTVPYQQEFVNLCECVLSGGSKCDTSCGCKQGLAYPELPGSNPFCGCYCACCDEHPSHHTKCPSAITLTHPDGPKRVGDVCLSGAACQTRFDPARLGTSGLIGVDALSKEGIQQGFIARFGLAGNFLSQASLAIFNNLFFDQCAPQQQPRI